jgi:general secretion pathway protein D
MAILGPEYFDGVLVFVQRTIKSICFIAILTVATTRLLYAEPAKQLFKDGQAAEAHEDWETAYTDYSLALEQAPGEIQYKVAVERTRFTASTAHIRQGENLLEDNRSTQALVEFRRALQIDPGNARAKQDLRKAEARAAKSDGAPAKKSDASADNSDVPGSPPRLDAHDSEPLTLQMTEQSNVIFQTVGKIAGVNVLIDPDYMPKRISIDLKDVTVLQALTILDDLTNCFWKPVTHNTIFVAQNTPAKRKSLEEQAVRIFYLANVTQQSDLNDIQTALRNVMTTAKLFSIPSQNAILVRGTPDELLLAKSLILGLDRVKPEVLVDVYVMEVRRDKLHDIGLSPPTSLSVSSTSSETLNNIGDSSSYTYSIGEAAAEMLLTDSSTRLLQNPRIRAVDGQKATLKIGERLPIATGSYTSSSTTTAVETQFQYIDVGVNVEMTPTIHENHDVTMKLTVEISSENGTETIDDVAEPIISQQKSDQMIRLKEGEVSILAGLIEKETTHSVSGTPGLGQLPVVKYLFSTQDHEVVDDEIVFMLIPHIVRAPEVDPLQDRDMSTGSGDTIRLRRVAPNSLLPISQDASAKAAATVSH